MLLTADSDDKYIVVEKTTKTVNGKEVVAYTKLDDAKTFLGATGVTAADAIGSKSGKQSVSVGNGSTKKAEDLTEAYSISYKGTVNGVKYEYILVNTSGKVIDSRSKSKDGNDYYYVTEKKTNGENAIVAVYVED